MARRQTVENTTYTPLLRFADATLGLVDKLGWHTGDLDQESILAEARRRTGLQDYGDPAFLEPMRMVIDNASALGFTHLSRTITRGTYTKAVANRLLLADALKKDPGIRDVKIERPIFVLGFPRSGTTLVQNLLSQVPSRRGLQFWELITPFPVHPDPIVDRRRRIRLADGILKAAYVIAPEMADMHAVGPTTFEECWYLFCNTFCVLNWDLMTGLDDYGRWLLQHDMSGPYEEYKLWLQVLVRQRPTQNLLLKCPEHLWFVDDLLKTFPDACIVWTHRDPVASVASYASLMTLPRRMVYGEVDLHEIGQRVTDRFDEALTRAMAAHDRADPSRFYHVDFRRLLHDPKAVIHDIVRHFDLDDPPDHDARLDAYLNTKRSDEQGKHVYSAERYGIDPRAVRERYRTYIERFNVAVREDRG